MQLHQPPRYKHPLDEWDGLRRCSSQHKLPSDHVAQCEMESCSCTPRVSRQMVDERPQLVHGT
jgi:hypothetical protein